MAVDHADRARIAHRVLRVVENGVTSDEVLSRLSAGVNFDAEGNVIGSPGHPLGRVAGWVEFARDPEAPGPTDEKFTNDLLNASLDTIWQTWNESSRQNLQDKHPEDLAEVEAADAAALAKFEEKRQLMEDSGRWPVHPYFGHGRHVAGAANALYDNGREGFLEGAIDWDTAVIKVMLVDSADYTVNLATHEFVSSIAAGGREETSGALGSKTVAAGVADAADLAPAFAAAAGDPCEALVIFQSSAVGGGGDVADTAQRLIAYIDTATGLPVTLNGGDVNITWDSGANRIFKL
jgi:hypothetical protein